MALAQTAQEAAVTCTRPDRHDGPGHEFARSIGGSSPTPDAPEVDELNLRCLRLLPRIAREDHDAFVELYEATTARMWPLALRIVGRHHAAEDVLADLYLQVWRTADSYDPGRSLPLAWMTVICRSRALDLLRRRDRAEPSDDIDALADTRSEGLWADDSDDSLLEVPSGSLRRQNLGRLDLAMRGLPALRRQLLALACFHGMSHSELASHFDLPLGTVKSHMRAALTHVRGCLSKESAQ